MKLEFVFPVEVPALAMTFDYKLNRWVHFTSKEAIKAWGIAQGYTFTGYCNRANQSNPIYNCEVLHDAPEFKELHLTAETRGYGTPNQVRTLRYDTWEVSDFLSR